MVLERLNVQPEQSTVDWHGASGVRGPLLSLSVYSSSMSAAPGHPPQARTPTTTGTTTSST